MNLRSNRSRYRVTREYWDRIETETRVQTSPSNTKTVESTLTRKANPVYGTTIRMEIEEL